MTKVCEIVRKQLALPTEREVCGESKFAALGADSLDTVKLMLLDIFASFPFFACLCICSIYLAEFFVPCFLRGHFVKCFVSDRYFT